MSEQQRIYLACPYSDPDGAVMEQRFQHVTRAAHALMRGGHIVFSPVTHGHAISALGELPSDFIFWREHCLSFLRHWATCLYVCLLPGLDASVGVRAEVEEARRLGLPVYAWQF